MLNTVVVGRRRLRLWLVWDAGLAVLDDVGVAAGEGHGDAAPVAVGVRTVMEKRRFNK